MDEFRDDGTRVCPIHGLRFDPELSGGCIRCAPSPSQRPRKKSTIPPKTASTSNAPDAFPPSYDSPPLSPSSYAPSQRISAVPPMPIEPFAPNPNYGANNPYETSGGGSAGGPKITIIAGPERRRSRRTLIRNLGLLAIAGAGGAAWYLSPDGPTDWSKKVREFHYGPSASLVGAMFVPSGAGDEPRPLLVLIDPTGHPAHVCARFARACEHYGWIAVSSAAFGGHVAPTDGAQASLLLDETKAMVKVDAARPFLAGFDVAGDVACRLAIMQPDVFAGAILECSSIAPWRDVGAVAQNDVSFFLAARSKDGTREGMATMKDEMERRGLHVTWDEISGGHEPRERDELDSAFAWLQQMHG